MAREIDDERLYEYACKIVDSFEKAALKSGTREGILAVVNGPLEAMDQMCKASEFAIGKTRGSNESTENTGVGDPQQQAVEATLDGVFGRDDDGDLMGSVAGNVKFDADLTEALDATGIKVGDRKAGDWLKECLGCDLRLNFDWQLQPINLLGPINAMLNSINVSLDGVKASLNPMAALGGFCEILNAMKTLCPPDLIAVLLSLKLLYKKYLAGSLEIRLDWTLLLGPILKAIVQGIAALINNISLVLMAPLDCAVASLKTANELEKQVLNLSKQVASLVDGNTSEAQAISKGKLPVDFDFNGVTENLGWPGAQNHDAEGNATGSNIDPDRVPANVRAAPQTAIDISANFELTRRMTMSEALKHPGWGNSSLLEKLIVPVQEARNYIQDLIDMILGSLRSMEGLVSGGISLHVEGLLALLYIADLISVVVMIIKLLSSNPNVQDWCGHLEENPGLLEDGLRARFGSKVKVDSTINPQTQDRVLALRKGPELLGEIKLCSNGRSTMDNQLLQQWISDLNRKKGV